MSAFRSSSVRFDAFDAFSLKPGLRFIKAEILRDAFRYCLLERVEKCGCLVRAVENTKRIAIYEIRGGCREADHSRIEIIDNLREPLENRTMRFIENIRSKNPGLNSSKQKIHRLLRGNKEALCRINTVRVNSVARLMRQMRFETVCQRLLHECIPISQEQNVLRLVCS